MKQNSPLESCCDEDRLGLSVALLDGDARPPLPRGDHLLVEGLPRRHAVTEPGEAVVVRAGPVLYHASEKIQTP